MMKNKQEIWKYGIISLILFCVIGSGVLIGVPHYLRRSQG